MIVSKASKIRDFSKYFVAIAVGTSNAKFVEGSFSKPLALRA